MSTVGSNYSYRDYLQEAAYQGANKTDETSKTSQEWDMVVADKDSMGVTVDDFLKLMVAQLTNQDFMNPVDDTQYVTQLAQFATMQQMQEMASYMKTNYVLSLAGQTVTCAKFSISGELKKETGPVERISLVNGEYAVYVNGQKFTLAQIMEIHQNSSSSGSGDKNESDPNKAAYLTSLMGKNVTVEQKVGDVTESFSGIVTKVSMKDGKYRLQLDDDEWYELDEVVSVEGADKTEDPEDPGDVTDPDDPGDVTDPDDPGDVVDPENPGDVTDPDDPGDVVDPENPGDVTDPDDPGDVTDPVNPDEVVDPENPGDATDPESVEAASEPVNTDFVVRPQLDAQIAEELLRRKLEQQTDESAT